MAALSPAVALDGQVCVLRSALALASPDDLRAHIEDRLTVIAAEELGPWCNLGTVMFRRLPLAGPPELGVGISTRGDRRGHGTRAHPLCVRADPFLTWAGQSGRQPSPRWLRT
jgi:hypothetical protein